MTMLASLPQATGTLPSRETGKSVAVIVRRGAKQAPGVEEALRVALGQTLAAGRVIVAFVEAGVWAVAVPPLPGEQAAEIEKHLGMLLELDQEVVAERDALETQGIRAVRDHIAVQSREEVLTRLGQADAVLVL
jgi:hypothetical protein